MEELMGKNLGRAKLVREAREERAWPQRQLAEIAEVNLRTIQRLERDGTASFETLMAVASAFDMDVKDLTPKSKSERHDVPEKKVYHLPRLVSGNDLAHIFRNAEQFVVEHDEADDVRAVNGMADVVNYIKRDIVRWHDADPAKRIKIEFDLTQEIRNLENFGFYLFGIQREVPQLNGKKESQIRQCTIYMSHARSPKVIRDRSGNMVIPAVLADFAQ